MTKHFESLTGAYRMWTVFEAWAECTAIAIANAVTLPAHPIHAEREARYLNLIKPDPARAEVFPKILAHLVDALTLERHDALGSLFHEHELASADRGQFFTPYEVSKFMAGMIFGDGAALRELVDRQGFVTMSEPACGAGGMIIAAADAMLEADLNPQAQLHVTAIDVDSTAAHMAFIQLSLLGIPAIVFVGNTLSMVMRERFLTPAHVLGGWEWKLRHRDTERATDLPAAPHQAEAPRLPAGDAQLHLFEAFA